LIPVSFPLSRYRTDPDSAGCKRLFEDVRNPYYIRDHPGLTQTLGWVDAWTSKPSVYAVAARNAQDVAAAVKFAEENNLRLVVKGGGHSYQGTSNAPASLLVWTRHMTEVTTHPAFVPQGCKNVQPQAAVTLGAGTLWMDAYEAVTTRGGRFVQGGGCMTVGVPGLVQSGGFGSFSKHFGTAAANLLEAEVVTSDGEIRIVNAGTHPDLFWALKGGGGGTFGVVTKVTLLSPELPEFFGAAIFSIKASSDAAYHRLVREFVSTYREHLFNDHWGEQVTIRPDNLFRVTMVSQGLDREQIRNAWKPFLDWVGRSPHAYELEGQPILASLLARDWWNVDIQEGAFVHDPRPGADPTNVWWKGDGDQAGQYLYGFESLWLPAALLEDASQEQLAQALFQGSRHWGFSLHFNKGLAGALPATLSAARNTAMNPAVLTAFALAISADGQGPAYPGIQGHEPDVFIGRKAASRVNQCINELRSVAPDPGAYVSESNYFEKRWQDAYWGSNYPRLAAIKKKYDPSGLFFVHNGVGSEVWSQDGFVRQ
jgi:FAD/FMN-containing dehydrogenase